jgi:hypothetical protein
VFTGSPAIAFDLAVFRANIAGYFNVSTDSIAPIKVGGVGSNATVVLVFRGDLRAQLQDKMASLTRRQLAEIDVYALGWAPAQVPTPAPPSEDLERANSTIWIYGAAGLGGVLGIAGVAFLIRTRKTHMIATTEDMDVDTPMLQMPGVNRDGDFAV